MLAQNFQNNPNLKINYKFLIETYLKSQQLRMGVDKKESEILRTHFSVKFCSPLVIKFTKVMSFLIHCRVCIIRTLPLAIDLLEEALF